MLSRRLARAVTAPTSATATPRSVAAVRMISSSLPVASKKTPALADVHPDQYESFISKQKTFREQLVAAQKEREASVLRSSSPSSLPEGALGLGSLKTGHEERTQELSEKEAPRKQGPLSNLIYGTKEGREHDAQLEASFSQVLARGKYMHSIVFHQVKPDKVDEYVDLVGNWYPRMASLPENKVHLVGSWRTEVGECDTFSTCTSHSHLINPGRIPNKTTSSHLGVSTLHRLSRFLKRDFASPRVPRLRPQTQESYFLEEKLADAGIQLLAHHTPSQSGWGV